MEIIWNYIWKNFAQDAKAGERGEDSCFKELVSGIGKEAITKHPGRCPNQAASKNNACREHREKNVALNPSSVDYYLVYRKVSFFCKLNNMICICVCGFLKA